LIVIGIAFATAVLILPVKYVPAGLFLIELPRYVLLLPPIVFAATLPPLVQKFERMSAALIVIAAAGVFVTYAVTNAVRDVFVPFEYVVWASENRGARLPPHASAHAAAAVVDHIAGPYDRVAVDIGSSSLLYLAFGRGLTRDVMFVPPGAGPPVIPRDAQWLVVDRAWSVVFGDPAFRDLTQASRYFRRGTPVADDLRVLRYALHDPQWELVYLDRASLQAVFKRR
jgi:hypothetical protein